MFNLPLRNFSPSCLFHVATFTLNLSKARQSYSSFRRYNSLAAPNITCLVADNDVAGIELSYPFAGGSAALSAEHYATQVTAASLVAEVTEGTAGGSSGTGYGLRLRSRPYGTVVVQVMHSHTSHRWLDANQTDGYIVAVQSVTFTSTNWAERQPVYVLVVDDEIARPDPSFTVQFKHNVTSTSDGGVWSGETYRGDPAYNRIMSHSQPELLLVVKEDDVAGVYQSATLLTLGIMYSGQPLFVDDFTFALSSQPTHTVSVRLHVRTQANPRVESNQTRLSATRFTFTRQDWAVERHVYVNATSDVSDLSNRDEYIYYEISSLDPMYGVPDGNGVASWNSGLGPRLAVEVVVSSDGAPPPKLISSWFLASGAGAELVFDRATNRAGLTATFSCTSLLYGPAVDHFGEGATCSWPSTSVLRVRLSSDATVISGETFHIKSKMLKNSFAASTLYANNVTDRFYAPPSAVAPVAILSAPSTIGSCDDLLVDGSLTSGSGGRALKMFWNLTFPGLSSSVSIVNMTSIVRDANRDNALFLTFKKSHFPPMPTITMEFWVVAKNWLGNYDETSLTVRKGNNDPPVVRILGYGASIASFAAESLALDAAATMPACNPGSTALAFEWSEPSGLLTLSQLATTATVSPKKIKIPAGLLTAMSRYTFRVTTWVQGAHLVNTSAEVVVTAKASALFAAVSGGSYRMQSRNEDLTLDGSLSYDPDDLSSAAHLNYSWACAKDSSGTTVTLVQSSCTTTIGTALSLAASPRTTVAASSLSSGSYTFTLWIFSAADGRNASATVVVKLATLEVPQLSIRGLKVSKVNPNPGTYLQLRGRLLSDPSVFEGDLSYLWTKTSGDDPSVTSPYASVFAAAPTRLVTVLQLGALTEGQTYNFRLTASVAPIPGDTTSNITSSFSELSVVVNSPPSSGSFVVSPGSGVALTTSFTLACASWVDDESDLPLSYAFFVAPGTEGLQRSPLRKVDKLRMAVEKSEKLLMAASPAARYTTLLPEGGGSGNLSVVVYIRDRFGGSTRASTEVGVGSLAGNFKSIFGRRRRPRLLLSANNVSSDETNDDFSGFLQNLTDALMEESALSGDSELMITNAASVASVANSDEGSALMTIAAQTSLLGSLIGSILAASNTIAVSDESVNLLFGTLGSISNNNADRLDDSAQVRA